MFSLFLSNARETNLVYSYLLCQDFDEINFIKKDCQIDFSFDSLDSFSNILTNLIINVFEEDLIKQSLEKHYCYFSSQEQLDILKESFNIIKEDSNSKKDLIYFAVYDYVQDESFMVLSGFIKFRLKDYIEVLEYLVDLSVNNYIINREYDRFISLLKEYIFSSIPKSDVVHLVFLKEESILLDKNRNIIPFNDDILDAKYLSDITFSSNDFCLNTLLNILPKKIYVHTLTDKDIFLDTLKKIFGNRLCFCNSCEICDFYKCHSSSFNVEN